jgi:hypothetical protein
MENYNRVEKTDYAIYYYLNYKYHRLDGPAREYSNGDKFWYQNGLLHRLDGPAIFSDGDEFWYQNGLPHRLDGPAVEYSNGEKYWYYEGEKIECNSQKEFEKYVKLKLFW